MSEWRWAERVITLTEREPALLTDLGSRSHCDYDPGGLYAFVPRSFLGQTPVAPTRR